MTAVSVLLITRDPSRTKLWPTAAADLLTEESPAAPASIPDFAKTRDKQVAAWRQDLHDQTKVPKNWEKAYKQVHYKKNAFDQSIQDTLLAHKNGEQEGQDYIAMHNELTKENVSQV